MTLRGTPSRAISTACAWRSWWGGEASSDAGGGGGAPELLADGGGCQVAAAGRSVDHAKQGTDGQFDTVGQPWPELVPAPLVHADLAAFVVFAVTHEDRAARLVKVAFLERQRFADPQAGAPQHDDQSADAMAVRRRAGAAHDEHDLFDRRRVGGVAHALVARRTATVMARQRRR